MFAGAVLVNDTESWVYKGRPSGCGAQGATGVMIEWKALVKNQRPLGVQAPKLVCIELQPYSSTQGPERDNILNVGGE